MSSSHLAIDLGAGSGRAILGQLTSEGLRLQELHRFRYEPSLSRGHLRWPFARIVEGIRAGIETASEKAGAQGEIRSIGVDSWGVDYGLLDARGRLLEDPVAYRDARTEGAMPRVFERVPRAEIFRRTGLQFMELNTLYQLFAQAQAGFPEAAARLLMMPDLCHHYLCGSEQAEYTDASTTQLLDARARSWDTELIERLGLPQELLPEIVGPGSDLGVLRPQLQKELHVGALRVVAPATHDTASAVAGTPLRLGWAYISSGTWSLVGVELDEPLISDAAAAANFTNEGGVSGTIRLLKNVMGLWLLESCRKEWQTAGASVDYETLLREVSRIEEPTGLVYPDHQSLFNPESMTSAIGTLLSETGQEAPEEPAQLTKCLLDSLALRYASVIDRIATVTGREIPGIHVVGGGSRNDYLNQATADAAGRPVLAGPVEATAMGNLMLQAIVGGELASLAEARERLAATVELRRFEPRPGGAWAEAREHYAELEKRFA